MHDPRPQPAPRPLPRLGPHSLSQRAYIAVTKFKLPATRALARAGWEPTIALLREAHRRAAPLELSFRHSAFWGLDVVTRAELT